MSEAQNGGNVMKRLTYWNEEYGCWSYHCGSGEAANRLAAYEETGRTPEEVTALEKLFDYALEESKTLTEQLALLNRIHDLAKADKEGRLVVLPYKVGDTVYYWDGCQIIDYKVENFSVFDGNEWLMYGVHREKGNGIISFGREFWAHEFYYCKTVFLTHEEAEKALEAMKDE